jgi:maleamate amidohydrolase
VESSPRFNAWQAYLDKESPIYAGVEDALASATRVLEAARKAGIPVIHTNVEFLPGGFNGGEHYTMMI